MEFSVLMSVYYKENPEYLKLSLDSVIKQTVPATEIVLIKDGPLTKELTTLSTSMVINMQDYFVFFFRRKCWIRKSVELWSSML